MELCCSKPAHSMSLPSLQQANKYKSTWMHPLSKHWHMLDYIILHQRDLHEIYLTWVVRCTDYLSDHRLVRCVVALNLCPPNYRHAKVYRKKPNVSLLQNDDLKVQFKTKLDAALTVDPKRDDQGIKIEEDWKDTKGRSYQTAVNVLGYKTTKHLDWFNDQDLEACRLFDEMHVTNLAWKMIRMTCPKSLSTTEQGSRPMPVFARWRRNGG